jgi:aspartate/methionine/tyrosine aminotransferase
MFAARTNWKLTANRFAEAQARVRATGREVLDLTASNPTQVGLHYDTQAILASLVSEQALRYAPEAKGLLTARQAVAQYYRERDGTRIDPESAFLTTSTSEAYSFVFRLLCEPSDEILVPAPSYPLFEFLADIQDVHLVPYPLIYDHGWQIDLHVLEQAITPRTRAVIVVHPNNPTGSFVKPHEAASLSGICARYQLAILADEVFLDFALDGMTRQSFARDQNALTFTLSGLSKIAALPQMKLAWIVASGPQGVTQQAISRLEVIADTYLSVNTPIQLAAPTMLEQRHSIQRQLNGRVLANLAELDRRLAEEQGIERLDVEGGWYAVLRVPVIRSDEDLAIELLEREGILVHPGHFYDFPRDGYLVLSLITSHDEFADGVKRVLAFLK